MNDCYEGSLIGALGLTREHLGKQFTGYVFYGQYIKLNCPSHLAVQNLQSVTGREFPINSSEVKAMREWLFLTWDKAHQIELVIKDARVNRPSGNGPGARNSLPSLFWYKDIAKIISAIVTRFGYGKAYEAFREMAENNGIKFYELQRFCDTAQICAVRTKSVCQLIDRLVFYLAGSRGACERCRGRETCNIRGVARQDERLSLGGKRDHVGRFIGIVYE
jgi:hypothetical protein